MSPEEAPLTLNGRRQHAAATTDHVQVAERARSAVAVRPSGIDQSEIEVAASSELDTHIEALHNDASPRSC